MSEGVQSFYGRWARPYDALARHAPVVGRLRARAADGLDLASGDTVVDVGCGTGANLPHLRERVGPGGTVVGVDVTGPMLARARRLVARRGWANVHLVRGDGARLPVTDADAVLATFVVGMFEDPAAVVDGWCDLVGPGGRVALLDAARSDRAAAAPVNLAFDAFTVLSTPPTLKLRYDEPVGANLRERVETARGALDGRGETTHGTHLLGLLWLSACAVR
jgi:phosphatidylethanolamine/phosphatidyl-N-methylethanolamine N-methyltransferase